MKIICSSCKKVYDGSLSDPCPKCASIENNMTAFQNNDDFLNNQVPKIQQERKNHGLTGIVNGLNAVIINTEPNLFKSAVEELLMYTGHHLESIFENSGEKTAVLKKVGSASILIKTRIKEKNPFRPYNLNPKSQHLPNTRLETFIFEVKNLSKYVEIQRERGFKFLTPEIIDTDNYSFIQTPPSKFIGTSYGFIQSHKGMNKYDYHPDEFKENDNFSIQKPDFIHLKNIDKLDHTATRVRARDRDAAIIEFMKLTNYNFDFAIYVNNLNSITNVARLSANDFAMVFTSGIVPFLTEEDTGPTEKYTYNYGTRVHHMAFRTEKIDHTYEGLKNSGMKFLIDLVGSPDEGLKQTFSVQSPFTLIVNEYIHRFGDFDGFFTKSNVQDLTRVTEKQ
ncbi:hypothetical protein [Candidatus Harpocratesius sp.]